MFYEIRDRHFSNVFDFLKSQAQHLQSVSDVSGYYLFSSSELRVSYCDRPKSGVRRPSAVNNFFKHLLLLNRWANFDETWQGCFLGEALQKSFKEFNFIHNSGCHAIKRKKNCKIFENLLL